MTELAFISQARSLGLHEFGALSGGNAALIKIWSAEAAGKP
jgi:hypothetical protein